MEPNLTPAAPPADLAEYKALKAGRATGSETTPPVDKQAPPVPEGESAAASGAPTQETQDKGKKKAANAEERAAELRAAGRVKEADEILARDAEKKEFEQWKASKADREREAEELRQLRARQTAAVPAAPAAAPEAKPAAASPAEGKPKLKDFLAKPENKGKEYEDVVEDWEDACATWRKGVDRAEAEKSKLTTSFNEKIEAVRAKHSDYDQKTSGDNFRATIVKLAPQAVAVAAHELPHGVEVLYQLASDPDECRRIAGLSQASQIIEMGVMSRELVAAEKAATNPQQSDPEKPKPQPAVSKTPPPARTLGGMAPPSPGSNKVPTSLAEHKRMKAERAS